MPAFFGFTLITATPLAFARPDFLTPTPTTATLAPFAGFGPAMTFTVTVSGLPSAVIMPGFTVSARQYAGKGLGFGLTVGGLSGAGTTVTAESVLSAVFVSRPPLPVTV